MSEPTDKGLFADSAFPIVANLNEQAVVPGMSLRAYFAAKAMQGLLASNRSEPTIAKLAVKSFQIADYMIAASKA